LATSSAGTTAKAELPGGCPFRGNGMLGEVPLTPRGHIADSMTVLIFSEKNERKTQMEKSAVSP